MGAIRHARLAASICGASSIGLFKLKSLARNHDKIFKVAQTEKRPFIYRVTARNALQKML